MSQGLFEKFVKRLSYSIVGIACVLAAMAAYQSAAHHIDLGRYPPPGKLIDVDGYRMHIHCTGSGSPTVVFDSGLSDSSLSWYKVQPAVSEFARACSYDRAGLGWSDASPHARNSKVFAEELYTLLHRADIQFPIILVGHSMGGFDSLVYTNTYPQDVAGLVLVDSAAPNIAEHLPVLKTSLSDWRRHLQWEALLMHFGIPRLQDECGAKNQDLRGELRTVGCTPSWLRETIAETRSMWNESAGYARQVKTLESLPLIVISEDPAKNVKEMIPEFDKGQFGLMHLSTSGTRVTAFGSGHQVEKERPDLVIASVQNIQSTIKTSSLSSAAHK